MGRRRAEGTSVVLSAHRLLPGVAVSGGVDTIEGSVRAQMRVDAPGVGAAQLTAAWSKDGNDAPCAGTGHVLGHRLTGVMPAA